MLVFATVAVVLTFVLKSLKSNNNTRHSLDQIA